MMLRVKSTLKVLGLACAVGLCLGATSTWTGNGDGDAWQTCGNWSINGLICCYPCLDSDDAIIPYLVAGYSVDLSSEGIGDFSILGSVEFSGMIPARTLTVENLYLGASNADTVITITGATIEARAN